MGLLISDHQLENGAYLNVLSPTNRANTNVFNIDINFNSLINDHGLTTAQPMAKKILELMLEKLENQGYIRKDKEPEFIADSRHTEHSYAIDIKSPYDLNIDEPDQTLLTAIGAEMKEAAAQAVEDYRKELMDRGRQRGKELRDKITDVVKQYSGNSVDQSQAEMTTELLHLFKAELSKGI